MDKTFITESSAKGKIKSVNPKVAFRQALRNEDPQELEEAIDQLKQSSLSEDQVFEIIDEALLTCSKAGQANLVEVLARKGADVNAGEFLKLMLKELHYNGHLWLAKKMLL